MNVYVVVEGNSTEKKVYTKWIPYINTSLTYVDTLKLVKNNHFSILSGTGYPQYLRKIELAIEDINIHGGIDRFVVCADSDDQSYQEKYNEINNIFQSHSSSATKYIVVQHFCFETWALGNTRVFKRNPVDQLLRQYIRTYNVLNQDPEELPAYSIRSLNRSQFAFHYLKKILAERDIRYSKRNPNHVKDRSYLDELINRFDTTSHISSFGDFLATFR